MIEAVAEIGKFLVEKKTPSLTKASTNNLSDNLSSFLTPVKTEKVILICFAKEKEKFEYRECKLEKYLDSKSQHYLFSQGAKGGGTNFSPACILQKPKISKDMSQDEIIKATTEQVEKVFGQKVENWFSNKALSVAKKLSKQNELSPEDGFFIQSICKAVEENKNKIIEDIVKLLLEDSGKAKESFLLTILIDNKYIGEYEIFKKFLFELIKQQAGKSSSQDKTCCICKQKKENVSGTVNVFKFYTIDKPGLIKGGFLPKNAWKNFPVCLSCQTHLSEGRKYLEQKLQFNFYNFKYLLIPKLIFSKSSALEEVLDIFRNSPKNIEERTLERITDDENEILDLIATFNDSISVTFLFIVPEMGAERIVLLIEDVLPSHLRKIFDAKRETEKKFRKLFDSSDIIFTFQQIKHFFTKSNKLKKNRDLDAYFLEITESIFKKKPIDLNFLLTHFCRKLQDDIVHGSLQTLYTSSTFAMEVLDFLRNLKILKVKGDDSVMSLETPFDQLLNEFPVASQNPAVKGILLVGALCDMLLKVQSAALKKLPGRMPPFVKNLKGLKLKQSDIISLLPKIENKLMEYSAFGKAKKLVAEAASELLLKAPSDWKLSSDEISFYFVCGMNLGEKIKDLAKQLTGDSEEIEEEK